METRATSHCIFRICELRLHMHIQAIFGHNCILCLSKQNNPNTFLYKSGVDKSLIYHRLTDRFGLKQLLMRKLNLKKIQH